MNYTAKRNALIKQERIKSMMQKLESYYKEKKVHKDKINSLKC